MIDLKVQIYLAVLAEAKQLNPLALKEAGGLAAFAEKEAAKAIESINKLPDLKGGAGCGQSEPITINIPAEIDSAPKTDKIKKGDVVRLKSGGPHMTVARANVELLDCFWFSPDGIGKHSQSFAPEIVEKVK